MSLICTYWIECIDVVLSWFYANYNRKEEDLYFMFATKLNKKKIFFLLCWGRVTISSARSLLLVLSVILEVFREQYSVTGIKPYWLHTKMFLVLYTMSLTLKHKIFYLLIVDCGLWEYNYGKFKSKEIFWKA